MSKITKKRLHRQNELLRVALREHRGELDQLTRMLAMVLTHLADEMEEREKEALGILETDALCADDRTPEQISLDDFESAMVDHGWASEAEFVAEMERREKYPTNEERIARLNRNFPKHY